MRYTKKVERVYKWLETQIQFPLEIATVKFETSNQMTEYRFSPRPNLERLTSHFWHVKFYIDSRLKFGPVPMAPKSHQTQNSAYQTQNPASTSGVPDTLVSLLHTNKRCRQKRAVPHSPIKRQPTLAVKLMGVTVWSAFFSTYQELLELMHLHSTLLQFTTQPSDYAIRPRFSKSWPIWQ